MKVQIFLLFIALIAITNSQTCAQNPIYQRVKQFVINHEAMFENPDEFNALKTQFQNFEANTPAVVSDLTVCTPFNGQTTCCTNAYVTALKAIFKNIARTKAQRVPRMVQFLWKLTKGVGMCHQDVEKAKQFIEDDRLQPFLDKVQQCRKDGILGHLRLFRGTTCQSCINPSDIQTKLDMTDTTRPKLKITQANFDKYSTHMEAAFQCFRDALTEFKTVMIEKVKAITDSRCSELKARAQEFLTGTDLDMPSAPGCQGRAKFFMDGCQADLEDDGANITFGANAGRRFLVGKNAELVRRALQTTSDYTVDDTNGTAVYDDVDTGSESSYVYGDNLIAEENFGAEEIPAGQTNDSNASILAIGSILIFALLF